MEVRIVKAEEAVGHQLAHDLTQIDPKSGYKGARFKRGHVVVPEDLPVLLSMGREHLQVLTLEADEVHEDDAALMMARLVAGEGLTVEGPDEGRCTLRAAHNGLLLFNGAFVDRINQDGDWIFSTLQEGRPVKASQPVAAFRIRPLVVKRRQVDRALAAAEPIRVLPFRPLKVGLVTTGSEFRKGLAEDAFRPRLQRKLDFFGGVMVGQWFASDRMEEIAESVREALDAGAELVICTGGMSVDVDDRTPGAIRTVCDRISFQGVPSLPGSMLMLGWAGEVPVVGAPACVVHDERTTLDRLLPYLFAGLDVPEGQVRKWGVGGLCCRCEACFFPNCSFSWG
ncbi:molybdopterin biosynthesis enzyme [Thermanaerovibrio velox DSM 12556]|uniref:Molybdopterin biosynthesis enzyme n=1 Tax=Thermanaerovibrio velox DSM 12556 TaxID=926567 RepID=H0UNH2_9BACT|nr:molybdopterin-binding protein [Thermanaerovibrio velox]EHM09379.1 molybdopterin biosynthesis enzyme [Thermanaerovibrio velox DSM 12556]